MQNIVEMNTILLKSISTPTTSSSLYRVNHKKVLHKSEEKMHKKMKMT